MTIWWGAGALFGGMMGLFLAKSFTESIFVLYPAAFLGAVAGIYLSFLVRKRT